MDHFVKLWSSITDSSIWSQPPEQRVVWVTMLAMADENGFVGASVDGLARRSNVPLPAVEQALASFLAPDPHSRNQENEGRRIKVVPRGWHILNHGHFRDLRDKEARREYERRRKAEQRDKSRNVPDKVGQVPESPKCPAMSAQVEADAEGDADAMDGRMDGGSLSYQKQSCEGSGTPVPSGGCDAARAYLGRGGQQTAGDVARDYLARRRP